MLYLSSVFCFILILNKHVFAGGFDYRRARDTKGSSIEIPPLSPPFDVTRDQIKVVKIPNDATVTNNRSDPAVFVLIRHQLYWLKENALEELAVFIDPNDRTQKILDIIDIQGCQWENKFIFVVNTPTTNFVYILKVSRLHKERFEVLSPIQKLPRHGQFHATRLFTYKGLIYCILATNYPDENRSELRFAQWKHSFFQVVTSIMNANHQIDDLLEEPSKNIIVLIDNQSEKSAQTSVVHVYRYSHISGEFDGATDDLDVKRAQVFSVKFDLNVADIFLYAGNVENEMYLFACDENPLLSISEHRCEYYVWRIDGVEDTTNFLETDKFELLDAVAAENTNLRYDSAKVSGVMIDGDVLAFQLNDVFVVVDDKTKSPSKKSFVIHCPTHNLLYVLITKTRASSSGGWATTKLVCLYACIGTSECKGIGFKVVTHPLFEQSQARTKDSNREAESIRQYDTKDKMMLKMREIEQKLKDLKAHLISEQMEFLSPIQRKTNNMKKILKVVQSLREGTSISGQIIANKVKTKPNTGNTVAAVVLNSENDSDTRNITTLMQELKKANRNMKDQLAKQRRFFKRSSTEGVSWAGDTLHVKKLNLVGAANQFKDAVTRCDVMRNVTLTGKIRTKKLQIVKLTGLSGVSEEEDGTSHLEKRRKRSPVPFVNQTRISVKSINGVDWNEFITSLFRIGVNTVINGNLNISKPTRVSSLFADNLNGILVSDLMTTSTDQTINSNVFINNDVLVVDINSQIVNGMKKFAENVALLGRNNDIESRVKISVCNVSDSLTLSDKEGEIMTNNIVGTHVNDLTQIYNGQVTIRGALTLEIALVSSTRDNFFSPFRDASMAPEFREIPSVSNIFVNDIPFVVENVTLDFWSKSLDQSFGDVTFLRPITTPQLFVEFLNGHPITEFFVLDDRVVSSHQQTPLSVVFENEVSIQGNLVTDKNITTTLERISSESIQLLSNDRVTMNSTIIFKDRLIVDHLSMQLDTNDLLRRGSLNGRVGFMSKKQFTNHLSVDHDIDVSPSLTNVTIHSFNQFDSLQDLLNSTISFDQSQTVTGTLIFNANFHAHRVTIAKFIDNSNQERIQFDRHFDINTILSNISEMRENRIRKLVVNGDVQFISSLAAPNGLNITKLNGQDLTSYFGLVVPKNGFSRGKTMEIGGEKTFVSDLNADSISLVTINNRIRMNDWLTKAFLKLEHLTGIFNQTIDGPYWQFDTLLVDNLQVKSINDVQIVADGNKPSEVIFVDGNPENPITIKSDVSFGADLKIGSTAEIKSSDIRPCVANPLFGETVDLPQTNWYGLDISGNVNILNDGSNPLPRGTLSNFFQTAVLSNSDEIIGANIAFKTSTLEKFLLKRVQVIPDSSSSQENVTLINNINLMDLFSDAVTKQIISLNGQTQSTIIRGRKEFTSNDIVCDGANTLATDSFNVTSINGVNMDNLNKTLVSRNTDTISISAMQKLLFLQPLNTTALFIGPIDTITGVKVDDIFFIYSPRPNELSPNMAFERSFDPRKETQFHSQERFDVNLINGMSLKFFLENRLKLFDQSETMSRINKPQDTDGFLTFENLVVYGDDTRIEQINDIISDDVVLTQANEKQTIIGVKEIVGPESALHINKPSHVWKINRNEFVPDFAKTIFTTDDQFINRLTIHDPFRLEAQKGISIKKKFNGVDLETRPAPSP